jgi:serine/threonine protein kinase
MIHRDIKSDNILINKSGVLKICDFGLSALLTREQNNRATQIGTPHWTAPEIIYGEPYNQKVDIWSFGIFCYELAEGMPPFFEV